MPNKNKILDAWMMVEHLSEGDIKIDQSTLKFENLENDDYYTMLKEMLTKKQAKKTARQIERMGMGVYFDVFKFQEVICFLREKFHLQPPVEEAKTGNKFRFALYFDSNLNLNSDTIFFTESGYIQAMKNIPQVKEFQDYEKEMKEIIEAAFEDVTEKESFNQAFKFVLQRFGCHLEQCYLQVLNNLETDATNLHSFYIQDLNKAKTIETQNLHAYLFGNDSQRYNLDSKKNSPNFNPSLFSDILQPQNYPLGRFPSNTEYSLSLMQQVAVNLAVGYDNKQMRSVNGPPGTGKTTLLKDVFAELVVKQAFEMATMQEHTIKGNDSNIYYKKASIGVLPDEITDNNIVVASSNNGAVQNIVNELPLSKEIDKDLLIELQEADYFREIANTEEDSEKNWGMFSLEGGKSQNMSKLIETIQAMVEYFKDDEYLSDEDIYETFLKSYHEIKAYRDSFKTKKKVFEDCTQLSQQIFEMQKQYQEKQQIIEAEENQAQLEMEKIQQHLTELEQELQLLDEKLQDCQNNIQSIDFSMKSMEKPDAFSSAEAKEMYQKQIYLFNNRKLHYMDQQMQIEQKKSEIQQSWQQCHQQKLSIQTELQNKKTALDKWSEPLLEKQQALSELASELGGGKPLDMNQDYDNLQESNPWFDQKYRIMQSRLFILSLKVRKQFLYDNYKNLNAAVNIWKNQSKLIAEEKSHLIPIAWGWMNLAIPVISSTFASFSRMCANLNENSLGHLFIDEAGQALPQASVGAIFRSKHVMVVGDPSQIKPVLTLDASVLGLLSRHFQVDETYLSESASTQTLVDSASQYGFYREKDMEDESWIGIPLWVHRRCLYPMFTISNEISYNGLMVQANKKEFGKTGWYDVKGKATNKYVPEQAKFLSELLQDMIKKNPEINDHSKKDKVYIITPFANVAYMLSRELKKINFTRYAAGKPTNIGTVHTFQGKEAPIVFMVLGADSKSKGAANWAVSEPNMMNVAATRAKKEFYIIGDRALYKNLGSDVVKITDKIIKTYKKEHPDLVNDTVAIKEEETVQETLQKDEAIQAVDQQEESQEAEKEPAIQAEVQKSQPASEAKEASPVVDKIKETQEAAEAKPRMTGTITRVGRGKKSFYAYIQGDDQVTYVIAESLYSKIENANFFIKKGNKISFTPAAPKKEGGNAYIVDSDVRLGD